MENSITMHGMVPIFAQLADFVELPSGGYLYDVYPGEVDPEHAGELVRGALFGKAKKR